MIINAHSALSALALKTSYEDDREFDKWNLSLNVIRYGQVQSVYCSFFVVVYSVLEVFVWLVL